MVAEKPRMPPVLVAVEQGIICIQKERAAALSRNLEEVW